MSTGTMVACGTNCAITPATGVPCPASVLASRTPPAAVPPAPPPAPPPVVVLDVLGAVSRFPNPPVKMSVPGATRPRNEGSGGVDTGVDDSDCTVLSIVRNAQRAQIVQADQRAAR